MNFHGRLRDYKPTGNGDDWWTYGLGYLYTPYTVDIDQDPAQHLSVCDQSLVPPPLQNNNSW